MPGFDDDDGVTFTDNPLWSGRASAPADIDYNDEGVEWTANPLHAAMAPPVAPPAPAVKSAQVSAMAHWADGGGGGGGGGIDDPSAWWNQAAPRARSTAPAPPPPAAAKSGISDSMASAEMARRRAQQAMRIGPSTPASGFGGHSGGKRLKPTVAGELQGSAKEQDQMRHVAKLQRDGVAADIAALGPGRAPGYRGKDQATADARSIAEDPRFAATYQLDRATDSGGGAGRYIAGKKAGIKEFLASDNKKEQAGKYAARTAARAVPFAGSGMAIGGAVKEHDRALLDDNIAASGADDLTRSMAAGLADGHRNLRNKEAVSGAVGLVKDTVTVATGGLGALIPGGGGGAGADAAGSLIDRGTAAAHRAMDPTKLATKGAWKAGQKLPGMGANKLGDWLDDRREAHELRPGAVAPQARGPASRVQERTDSANAGLMRLAAGDGQFGARMLNHLNADLPALNSHQSVLDAAKLGDTREGADHTVRPSAVARVIQGEAARQRQKDRMGMTLHAMTENEDRGWWEQSSGPTVKQPAKPKPPKP